MARDRIRCRDVDRRYSVVETEAQRQSATISQESVDRRIFKCTLQARVSGGATDGADGSSRGNWLTNARKS